MKLNWDWKSDISHHVKGDSDGKIVRWYKHRAVMLDHPSFRYEDVVRRDSEVSFLGGLETKNRSCSILHIIIFQDIMIK